MVDTLCVINRGSLCSLCDLAKFIFPPLVQPIDLRLKKKSIYRYLGDWALIRFIFYINTDH